MIVAFSCGRDSKGKKTGEAIENKKGVKMSGSITVISSAAKRSREISALKTRTAYHFPRLGIGIGIGIAIDFF